MAETKRGQRAAGERLMHCSDLDHYLEAHLDGRLGRSRVASLRRHLAVCRACRRRVQILDAFAREFGERVCHRSEESIWSGLLASDVQGAALGPPVALALPPPPPGRGRTGRRDPRPPAPPVPPVPRSSAAVCGRGTRLRRLMLRASGLVVLAAAFGALVELLGGTAVPVPREVVPDGTRSALQRAAEAGLDIETGDPRLLAAWFEGVLGAPYPVPQTPPGYELLGGRRENVAGEPVAAIVYRRAPDILTLYVVPSGGATPLAGVTPASSWDAERWRFGLAGSWRAGDVEAFRTAAGRAGAEPAPIDR